MNEKKEVNQSIFISKDLFDNKDLNPEVLSFFKDVLDLKLENDFIIEKNIDAKLFYICKENYFILSEKSEVIKFYFYKKINENSFYIFYLLINNDNMNSYYIGFKFTINKKNIKLYFPKTIKLLNKYNKKISSFETKSYISEFYDNLTKILIPFLISL